ncbi:MAG: hypothetical protein QNJ54_02380 [Prochloraceae cyanobacterium]|nr:hypothetical protein [Prochloraceae cyanobacterium]
MCVLPLRVFRNWLLIVKRLGITIATVSALTFPDRTIRINITPDL